MKTGILRVALTVGLLVAGPSAQGADDASEKLRLCSLMGPLPRPSNNWIVSETTSPVDYSPVVIATAWSGGAAEEVALKLAIQCRAGRTDLVFASPSLTHRGEDYVLTYAVTGRPPVKVAGGQPALGTGVAVKGDIVRLLRSLPDRGEVAVRIAGPDGSAAEGRYSLDGLKFIRGRLTGPCRWPAAAGAPGN
jgi:hypothetical protein